MKGCMKEVGKHHEEMHKRKHGNIMKSCMTEAGTYLTVCRDGSREPSCRAVEMETMNCDKKDLQRWTQGTMMKAARMEAGNQDDNEKELGDKQGTMMCI